MYLLPVLSSNRVIGSIGLLLAALTIAAGADVQAQAAESPCSSAPAPAAPPLQYRNNAPPIPTLLTPAHAATATSDRPEFRWTPVIDREGDTVTFEVQIDDQADFSSPEVDGRLGPETSFTPERPLRAGTYCWRVRSIDDIEAKSPYTGAFAVTIQSARP
jgi:hypothetical protein